MAPAHTSPISTPALHPRETSPTTADPPATETESASFLGLPLEIRHEIYAYYLADFTAAHPPDINIAPPRQQRSISYFRALLSRTAHNICSPLTCTCRAICAELCDESVMLKQAMTSPHIKFVIGVEDFDYRPLTAFVKWLQSADNRFAHFIDSLAGKVVAELTLTGGDSFNGWQYGRWLGSCEKEVVGDGMEYRVKKIEHANEVLFAVSRLTAHDHVRSNIYDAVKAYVEGLHVEAAVVQGKHGERARKRFRAALRQCSVYGRQDGYSYEELAAYFKENVI